MEKMLAVACKPPLKKWPVCITLHRLIFVTMVVIFSVLSASQGVLANHRDDSVQNRSIPSNYPLPGDTPAQSHIVSKKLTDTKSSSTTGTTSTVRPWPSHNFFRTVLSKSDNVPNKENRPNLTRRSQDETGGTNSSNPLAHSQNENAPLTSESLVRKRQKGKYKVNRKRKHKGVTLVTHSKSANNETNINIQPKAFSEKSKEEDSNTPKHDVDHKPINRGKVQSQRTFLISSEREVEETTTSQQRNDTGTIYQSENSNHESWSNESSKSFINSPNVGFQYEIIIPPPTTPSSLHGRSTDTVSTSLLYFPSTTIPNGDVKYVTNEIAKYETTTLAVAIKTTEISYTTSTTPSMKTQASENEIKENSDILATSASTEANKDVDGQTSQNFLPPTHASQLNVHFQDSYNMRKHGSSSSSVGSTNGTRILQKNHLPVSGIAYPQDSNKPHTEIKPNNNDLSPTINHIPSKTLPASTTSIRTSTFLPIVKSDGERNSSRNTFTAFSTISRITHPYRQPTQNTHYIPSLEMQQNKIPQDFGFDIEGGGTGSNQSFHRPISPKYHDTIEAPGKIDRNHAIPTNDLHLRQTAVIRRRNMFTVINKVTPDPKIHVENLGNLTTKIKATRKRAKNRKPSSSLASVHDMKLHTQINQLERPTALSSASYLTGPDRTVKLENVGSDNDYFDEDDAQANLHHWIESSQGHSVGSSTELPRFTNLTWPYYITSPENNASFNGSLTGNGGTNASTAIAVAFTSQRDQKVPDFDSQYEFYIPAAAANPLQKPILISKKRNNKTAEATLESWTRVPTLASDVDTMKGQGESNMYHLKQSDHKSKIKHSHWGSNGLNIKIKAQKVKSFSQQLKQKQHHTTKVHESSTGKPKSTTSVFFTTSDSHQTPFTFSTFKHQKHFLTSPSSLSAWPFAGAPGQTEIASFVTAKTPTNIWYKPTINHFTASQPVSGTYSYETDNKVINRVTSTTSTTTTKQPPATEAPNVGGYNAPTVANTKDKTFQGESNSNNDIGENDGNTKSPILFNVWNLGTNGKLKLQNQKKIPAWALQGYIIPASGSILNLKQIPAALQPLVTSAMNKEVEEESIEDDNKPPHVWHPLPLFVSTPTIISTTTPTTIENVPDELLSHDEESNRRKVVTSQTVSTSTTGWSEEKNVLENASNKGPISINYVLWNNPSTIYGQSIILSTPSPQLLSPERNQPTLMPHFPQSPITPEASIAHSAAHLMTRQPESSTAATTSSTPASSTSTTTMSNEKLELIFQNYFQYYTTPKSSTTTPIPVTYEKDPHKLYTETSDTNAWNDLKKLILRLAASGNKSDKTSVALDKEDPENLELLENVAAIALIMSYLRNRYESTHTESPLTTLTTTPAYGVTNDMTPPHKDPLWATVYPLFQHFLNNPNFTFVPPPPPPPQRLPQSTAQSSHFSEFMSSITPTTESLVTSTEPMMPDFIKLNHFVSYYPAIPESPTTPSQIPISITEIPKHGATTQVNPRFDGELGDLEDLDTDKMKTLLLIHKLKKKKKKLKKLKRKKKEKLESALLGAALLHKISKPFMHVVKAPSKYWLDLKFDIDFYDIVKKKLLYFLAYRYMPVFMVLAFGLIPITLSFVPLLYKMWWSRKFKWPRWKNKYIHVPYPKPYPVPVHHHHLPPAHHHHSSYNNHGDHIFQGHHEQAVHQDSPPFYDHEYHDQDHFYAAATTGNDPNDKKVVHPGLNKRPPHPLRGHRYRKGVNSFNYAESRHTSSPASPPQGGHNMSPEEDQQIHVHIHDDETNNHPQFHPPPPPVTNRPISYTSYTKKDLLPYPSTASYGIGFDIGQTLAGMTNKHDMEILKILVENKKEKINKLLEMWKLAKYGVNVAKNAAVGRTTSHSDNDHGERQRKRRRKKRMS